MTPEQYAAIIFDGIASALVRIDIHRACLPCLRKMVTSCRDECREPHSDTSDNAWANVMEQVLGCIDLAEGKPV